jgi:alpha-tubulin suppressor-like RCC1 family protein
MFHCALLGCASWSSVAHAATPMVAIGSDHAIALRSDGTVVSWGSDQSGQLGSGRVLAASTAAAIAKLPAARSIAAGLRHSIAVGRDGAVWVWGMNYFGQVGDGTTVNRSSPTQVPGINNAVMACGSDGHTSILRQDRSVWSWGANYYGQLGVGTQDDSLTPVRAVGVDGITSIACGHDHVIALRQDGTVWAWGQNWNAELGDGSTTDRWQAVQVSGLNNVVAVAAGSGFSAAVKQDGTVWEWGYDAADATPANPVRMVPTRAANISGARSIAAAANGSQLTAVGADGVTWWSWNAGTNPEKMAAVGSLVNVAPAYSHTLMLKADGAVLGFGDNFAGELGDGTQVWSSEPVQAIGLPGIVAIAPGDFFSLALDASGKVWAWGDDTFGQLGRSGVLTRSLPGEVLGLRDIVQVSTVANHNLALDQGGNVWAWGEGGYSQLGNDTYLSRSTPIKLSGVTDVQSVAAGFFHSLALKRDGTVWAWGSGFYGQIGNGSDADSPTPVQVARLSGITAIAASSHSLALKQDGTVWAWGSNDLGALGLGTSENSNVPTQVPGLGGVKAIAATRYRSITLKADGTVMAWGDNYNGELGDGSTTERHLPVAAIGLTGVVEIAAGFQHTLARKADGTVWGWGYDSSGELGHEAGYAVSIATPIASLSSVQQIAAGAEISGMLRSDGLLYMGGRNTGGQLGDGTFALHDSFVLAVNPSANGFLNLKGGPTTAPAGLNVPFFVMASGGIASNIATVRTTTKFNADDAGKAGAVFITAKVPAGTLAADVRPAGNKAGARDDNSFVLVQLTASGWQQVVNGQLIPYSSGVLGDLLAAQNILNNTDTSKLKGAEFCLGYGSNAAEMVAGGRMLQVASIPNPAPASQNANSCMISGSASAKVSPLTGLWWNPNESGWGISLTQQASTIFVAWYTYDQAGKPSWFVMSNCAMAGNSCSGDIYAVSGGTSLGVPWNGAGKLVNKTGVGTITFSDNDNAVFNFTINGANGSKTITRQVFGTGSAQPTIDYSALWWNPSESGWGLALTQQYGMIFATIYTYDANGNPIWYVASSCPLSGAGCSGDLYQVNGGSAPAVAWNGANKLVTKVGSASFTFSDGSNGTMTYTVNGVAGSRAITRQLF